MTKVEAFVEVNTTTKCDIKNILQIIIFPLFTYKVTKLGIWSVGIPFSWVFFSLRKLLQSYTKHIDRQGLFGYATST
jgi:fructose-specific phosphotransferase system IIC component